MKTRHHYIRRQLQNGRSGTGKRDERTRNTPYLDDDITIAAGIELMPVCMPIPLIVAVCDVDNSRHPSVFLFLCRFRRSCFGVIFFRPVCFR